MARPSCPVKPRPIARPTPHKRSSASKSKTVHHHYHGSSSSRWGYGNRYGRGYPYYSYYDRHHATYIPSYETTYYAYSDPAYYTSSYSYASSSADVGSSSAPSEEPEAYDEEEVAVDERSFSHFEQWEKDRLLLLWCWKKDRLRAISERAAPIEAREDKPLTLGALPFRPVSRIMHFLRPPQEEQPAQSAPATATTTTTAPSTPAASSVSALHTVSLPSPFTTTGHLELDVLSAEGLANKDIIGLSDPYCLVYVVNENCANAFVRNKKKFYKYGVSLRGRTKTIDNDLNPTWKDHFSIVLKGEERVLRIECFDKDTVGHDDFLGMCVIDLRVIPSDNETHHVERQLRHREFDSPSEEITGKIHFAVQWQDFEKMKKEEAEAARRQKEEEERKKHEEQLRLQREEEERLEREARMYESPEGIAALFEDAKSDPNEKLLRFVINIFGRRGALNKECNKVALHALSADVLDLIKEGKTSPKLADPVCELFASRIEARVPLGARRKPAVGFGPDAHLTEADVRVLPWVMGRTFTGQAKEEPARALADAALSWIAGSDESQWGLPAATAWLRALRACVPTEEEQRSWATTFAGLRIALPCVLSCVLWNDARQQQQQQQQQQPVEGEEEMWEQLALLMKEMLHLDHPDVAFSMGKLGSPAFDRLCANAPRLPRVAELFLSTDAGLRDRIAKQFHDPDDYLARSEEVPEHVGAWYAN